MKPKLLYGIYPKESSMYSWDRERLKDAGITREDYDKVMMGENVAGVTFFGIIIVMGSIVAWPITVIFVTLRSLRLYHTSETFRDLFKREPRPPKPKKVKVEKQLKGLEDV
jgi:hypothetical protein